MNGCRGRERLPSWLAGSWLGMCCSISIGRSRRDRDCCSFLSAGGRIDEVAFLQRFNNFKIPIAVVNGFVDVDTTVRDIGLGKDRVEVGFEKGEGRRQNGKARRILRGQ